MAGYRRRYLDHLRLSSHSSPSRSAYLQESSCHCSSSSPSSTSSHSDSQVLTCGTREAPRTSSSPSCACPPEYSCSACPWAGTTSMPLSIRPPSTTVTDGLIEGESDVQLPSFKDQPLLHEADVAVHSHQ